MMNSVIESNAPNAAQILTPEAARDLTDQIRTGLEGVFHLIKAAYRGRAWVVLGFSSWDEYVRREFGNLYLRPPLEERQDVVVSLRQAGMSLRSIATATQMSKDTVHRELTNATVSNETDAQVSTATSGTILGIDGKQRPKIHPNHQSKSVDKNPGPVEGEVVEPLPGQVSVDDVLDMPAADLGVAPLDIDQLAHQDQEQVERAIREFHGTGSAALPMTIKLASKMSALVSPVTGQAVVSGERIEALAFDVSRGVRTLSYVVRSMEAPLTEQKTAGHSLTEMTTNLQDAIDDLERILNALEGQK
ncbi:MAG: DNA-binding response regulator [Micrococcaceae bacterium]